MSLAQDGNESQSQFTYSHESCIFTLIIITYSFSSVHVAAFPIFAWFSHMVCSADSKRPYTVCFSMSSWSV